MRRQSPKTGMKSGETWDMDGCAFAYSTSSVTSMGPGMLRGRSASSLRCCEEHRTYTRSLGRDRDACEVRWHIAASASAEHLLVWFLHTDEPRADGLRVGNTYLLERGHLG